MRCEFENEFLNIIRAIVIDGDTMLAAEIASKAQGITSEVGDSKNSLHSFARWHQMEHFVDYALSLGGDSPATGDFYASVSVTTQQAEAAKEISSALSGEGIDHVLLKGTVIRSLYPEGWMRNSCDIDVLVHEDELDVTSKALLNLGYERRGEKSWHDIALFKGFLHIELHYKLIEDFRMSGAAQVLDNLWDVAVSGELNKHSYTLPDDYFYLYHIAHMAKHFGDGGCGIRSVLDTWILNNRCEFDKPARDALIKKANLESFENAMFRLSEYWFGNGTGEGLEDIERYIFSGGAYGTLDQKRQVRKSKKGRLGYICMRAFMGYKPLCTKYPVLVKHPYLFPVLEVWRWHEFFGNNHKNHAKELKDSLKRSDGVKKMINELDLSEYW